MQNIDLYFSRFFFNAGVIAPSWIIIFFGTYFIWFLGAALFFILSKNRKTFLKDLFWLFIYVAVSYSINIVIGILFYRHRPYETLGVDALISTKLLDKSFPSSHAVVAFTIAAFFYFKNKKTAMLFFLAAFLISISRVMASIHYLGDIIGGAILGIGVVFVFKKFKF